MTVEAKKLAIISWLASTEDRDLIDAIHNVVEQSSRTKDWWSDLSEEQKAKIEQGLKDVEEGRVISHEDVKRRYGL